MRIVVISDTHLALKATSLLQNWWVVSRWIAEIRPDLVVHLGDISLDGASNPAELRESARIFVDLEAPIRFLPGNHDVGDRSRQARLQIIRWILSVWRNTAPSSAPIAGRCALALGR
jgi:3',5'-cyclic AMP phosphodiesterase CpdA